jgi:hypothetical protein
VEDTVLGVGTKYGMMTSGDALWLFISAVPLLSRQLTAADTVYAIRIRPVVTEKKTEI